jgi:2-oxoglutarate ferredoxin oxidoreductase subunit alpha
MIDALGDAATGEAPYAFLEDEDFARVRFSGDSGDGMQLTGTQFADSAALEGHDLATFPDFPAEIRAPVGTTFGVSTFSINFGATDIFTAGDRPDVLVAMNPAALKVNAKDLRPGGLVIADATQFTAKNLQKAGYAANPLEDGSLSAFRLLAIDISRLTLEAVKGAGLSQSDSLRCKNMWVLGLLLWLFSRERGGIENWLERRFAKTPALLQANRAAFHAGHAYGETAELELTVKRYRLAPAALAPGEYCTLTGTEATAWGLLAGARLAGLRLFLGSYPITPASGILHLLSGMKGYGVLTFQAEDEIAAVCAALGAAYGGALGVTTSSGPGIALKTEALGLAVATELPLVVVNVQRGGPSTGLPTKTEQADLYQALWGRNGDTPLPVLAAASAGDCFDCAIEAVRIATRYMTPVLLLTDGYLANAAEPWRFPDLGRLSPFPARFHTDPEGFHPFRRDPETLARVWAVPGTPGLEHRIGGIERDYDSGHISYDPANHQRMTDARRNKILGIARSLPAQNVALGPERGRLVVVGWGSTFGPIQVAVQRALAAGKSVAHVHLRHLWPLPANLGALLANYERVLVPEMNTGQLATLLRAQYLVDAESLSKVTGQPFRIAEIAAAIDRLLG